MYYKILITKLGTQSHHQYKNIIWNQNCSYYGNRNSQNKTQDLVSVINYKLHFVFKLGMWIGDTVYMGGL